MCEEGMAEGKTKNALQEEDEILINPAAFAYQPLCVSPGSWGEQFLSK